MDNEYDQLTVPPDGRSPAEQPRWRQDFPIDWPQDEYLTRREFIKFLLLTSAAFSAGQLWFLVADFLQQREAALPAEVIARVEDVPIGGSLIFKYPAENSPARLLVRLDEERFVAYEQQCTHLTCPVIPHVVEGELHCPCHEGIFDMLTGRPLSGPPRRPLARVTLAVRDGNVVATGIEKRTV
ncbi:MAG: ubiquinol-cytochrome c reductase iron-sulfur subunit [Anaerolineales bacterium]|nr:ubiquinol-cytochrome c reductase iron-sulfur subunit [Anaerolineales bacterium]